MREQSGCLAWGVGHSAHANGMRNPDSTLVADNNLKTVSSTKDIIASGNTKMFAELWDPAHIHVSWQTLSGNQPATFGNVVSVWKGTQIGWGNQPEPILTMPVTDNSPAGDMVLELDGTPPGPPYIVAYGPSNSGTTYCAAQIVDFEKTAEPVLTQIDLLGEGTDSLLAGFDTLPGNNPKNYGNWIGLWEGESFRYDGKDRIARIDVSRAGAKGSQSMNHLPLTFNTKYTLVYACGPRNEDLAAWVTFKTKPFLARLLLSVKRIFGQR